MIVTPFENVWDMFRAVRNYAGHTGVRVVTVSSAKERWMGFETDCSEFRPEYRRWTTSLSHITRTGNRREVDLDGERVQHPEQEELLLRYSRLLRTIEGRGIIAEAFSGGYHPSREMVEKFELALRARQVA